MDTEQRGGFRRWPGTTGKQSWALALQPVPVKSQRGPSPRDPDLGVRCRTPLGADPGTVIPGAKPQFPQLQAELKPGMD